ncbi:zinc ribbon domain-containing protein [Natronococcus pandeyae]|uniref:zinc ribbon domain-containing protein n=1 Tax=Natronococcus pandeyae TaxID=2055836 RepID=UPI001652D5B8|nr:zinc ribbon domain-containing protein [Natronococcus pandeyae]
MGFFENLGRKVGKFTQEAKEAADNEASYACAECGERFYTEHDECPECGSEDVRELETTTETKPDVTEEDTVTAEDDGTEAGEATEPPTADESSADETPEPTDVSDADETTDHE